MNNFINEVIELRNTLSNLIDTASSKRYLKWNDVIIWNIKEKNDIAITFMEWDGKRSSFYYGETRTVIKNKTGSMDVVDHVKL